MSNDTTSKLYLLTKVAEGILQLVDEAYELCVHGHVGRLTADALLLGMVGFVIVVKDVKWDASSRQIIAHLCL